MQEPERPPRRCGLLADHQPMPVRDDFACIGLLLPAIRGAIPARDPRSLATLQAIDTELADDGYGYRYQPDERPLLLEFASTLRT